MPERKATRSSPQPLPFLRERILCVGTLAALAPVPLAFSFSLEPEVLLLFLAVVIGLLWRVRRGRIPLLGSWVLNLAGLAYMAFFYFDLRHGSRSLLRAVIHLVLFTTALKLASIKRESDFSMALMLTGLLFLGSLATSIHVSVILWVLLFTSVAWPSLVKWALWRDLANAPDEWRRDPEARNLPGAWQTALSVGASVLLAVPFFVVLPRLKTPFLTGLDPSRELLTGFSETVDPDLFGRLKQDSRVFMRLSLDRPVSLLEADRLYIRALAFARYDGRAWRKSEGAGEPIQPDSEGWRSLLAEGAAGASSGGVGEEASIHLTPLGSRYVPYPTIAGALRIPDDVFRIARGWFLDRDALGNLRLMLAPDRPLTFQVRLLARPPGDRVAPRRGDDPGRALGSDRIRLFLDEVTTGLDPEGDPEAYASRVAGYLAARYAYTLNSVRAGPSPVEEFLFERKAGQCETFATAMAMALREAGIPTRFVTGFSGGEVGFRGRTVIIRGRDAHAWVEAWCGPRRGWVLFDPTPPSGRPALEEVPWSGRLRQLAEGVGYFFDRFILSFRQGDQMEILSLVKDTALGIWGAVTSGTERFVRLLLSSGPLAIATLSGFLALFVFAARRVMRALTAWRSRRRLPPGSASYRRLQRTLREAGAKLGPASAPGETLAAAASLGAAARPARFIVEAYVAESFGGRPLDAVEVRRLELLLSEVRRAVSARKAA